MVPALGHGSLRAGKGGCWETQPLILTQVVMRYWEPVPRGPVLWEARVEPWATWVPLLCFVLHVISWLLIFSILLVFDYAELMGLKQVRSRDPCLRPYTFLGLLFPSLLPLPCQCFSTSPWLSAAPPLLCLPLKEAVGLLGRTGYTDQRSGSGPMSGKGGIPGLEGSVWKRW